MTQKQIFWVAVAVAMIIVASVLVYRQFTSDRAAFGTESMVITATPAEKKAATATSSEDVAVPVPETIDDIATSIESETTLDLSALDEEEAGSLSEIDADSNSVTNLGTSYDENNL
ncbi:MAG: hypothetical protein Q8O53_03255 [Candidatus Moranbacteria bacterium]|nr:hypothetical protein [Candidatus Moranbacteria bacterium]